MSLPRGFLYEGSKRCVKHAFRYPPRGGAPRGVMSGAYTLTPGPLPLVNSTPAFSSAPRMAAIVTPSVTLRLKAVDSVVVDASRS